MEPGVEVRVVGEATLADGRRAVPVFQLIAERYLDPQYAPEAVAATCGVPAETIRRLAAEIAESRSRRQIEIAGALDRLGRPAARDDARPPGRDARDARHLGPFQRVPDLPRAASAADRCSARSMCRAAGATSRRIPSLARRGRSRPASRARSTPGKPLGGAPLGYPMGPEDLILDDDGRPQRIDKAFSWEAPLADHGLMHMVITNAWAGDPYPIDTLFMYMANMAWNSAMNTAETMRMLTDKDPATGEYRIPRIIYSDAFYSETVAYADLILPDTTYLERWDCISMLDRPIGKVDGPADSIRQPILTPDRDVRPFQDVLIDLGARLGLPAFVNAEGGPRYPGRVQGLHRLHERAPGVGPLAGWRGDDGDRGAARARRTPTSSSAMSTMAASGNTSCRTSSTITSTPTRPISKTRWRWG